MSRGPVDVVGAGPAGLATAIALRREGCDVAVFDRRRPPLDKACGEGLMPEALDHLAALGVDLGGLGRPFAGIRYLQSDAQVEGRFPNRPGLGIRRTALHDALLARAQEMGVELHWRRPATLHRDGERFVLDVDGARRAPGWIVAADGMRSALRERAGLTRADREHRPRFGLRRHFRTPPWTDCVEVYWSELGEAYVTPVADDEVGVALLWRPDRERSRGEAPFDFLLRGFPRLADRLRGAPPASHARGLGPLRQLAAAPHTKNLLLVGDASGYLDAITGEGMCRAFAHARFAARALAAGRPRDYARAHRRHDRLPNAMTWLALLMSRRPALRRRVLRVLANKPLLFERILAVHLRERHPLALLGAGARIAAAGAPAASPAPRTRHVN